jgi:hypothetical protein
MLFGCFVSRIFMVLLYPQLWAGRFRGSNRGTGKIFFSSPQRPDRLWGPPSSFLGVKWQGLEVVLMFPLNSPGMITVSLTGGKHKQMWSLVFGSGDYHTRFLLRCVAL